MNESDRQRFWSKVDVKGSQDCWLWQAARGPGGYGVFWLNGTNVSAHRVAWAVTHGVPVNPADGGPEVVRHTCDCPPCCNPEHLRAGSRQDNVDDRERRGRGRTFMPRGEAHGRAKLSEIEVLTIRRLADGSRTYSSLALQFGVARSTIKGIVYRQTWAWLDPE